MIPFVRDFDFAHGRADQVSPRIQRVVANNPGPFTFTGTGTYLVGWKDGPVAIIDPGPDDPAHLDALTAAIGQRRVSHILVTHSHRDHAPLALPLARQTGAPILATRPPRSQTHASGAVDEDDDAGFQPDVRLEGGEVIQGEGWTLEAIFTPGHASNHMAFGLAEENALFCGDHVMGWSTTVVAPPDGDMTAYLASLDRVIAGDFQTLWPTHGPPITDPGPFLQAYRAHRLAREVQVEARLRAGDGTAAQIVPSLYASVDPALWPAAALSVEAHLLRLVRLGLAKREPDGGYRPA